MNWDLDRRYAVAVAAVHQVREAFKREGQR